MAYLPSLLALAVSLLVLTHGSAAGSVLMSGVDIMPVGSSQPSNMLAAVKPLSHYEFVCQCEPVNTMFDSAMYLFGDLTGLALRERGLAEPFDGRDYVCQCVGQRDCERVPCSPIEMLDRLSCMCKCNASTGCDCVCPLNY